MIDIPVSFRLDSNGDLLQGLAEDSPIVLMDVALDAVGENWSVALEGCAELLVPRKETLLDEYVHQSFYTAGVLACIAFRFSDAPETMIQGTLKQMALSHMPMSVLSDSNPLKGFEAVAREGHALHPEFKDHTDFVMEYYCETTQQPQIAKIAFCGAGVALFQLERAWQKSRELHIGTAASQAAQGIDWDTLPWTQTSED